MTNEEFEKKMEFIIEHQAQFSADIERLKELHAQAEIRMTQAEARMTRSENIIVRLYEDTNAKSTPSRTRRCVSSNPSPDRRAAQPLINVVERYISEGRTEGLKAGAKVSQSVAGQNCFTRQRNKSLRRPLNRSL